MSTAPFLCDQHDCAEGRSSTTIRCFENCNNVVTCQGVYHDMDPDLLGTFVAAVHKHSLVKKELDMEEHRIFNL